MGQGTECADRPTEVSVIRFVSRNRTIEEIAPKKEIYTCKQKGCGKIFTNQDEYRTHEALEELKIRFICREPGCGKELSDPGSMWRHYQECHSNETNVFVCPYTNCGSVHSTSENLEEHIESNHRQPPTLPTEPEIICFEGPGTTIDEEETPRNEEEIEEDEEDYYDREKKAYPAKQSRKIEFIVMNKTASKDERLKEDSNDQSAANALPNNEMHREDFYSNKYDESHENNDKPTSLFVVSDDYTIERSETKMEEHQIDLGNLERVFRSGLEAETTKIEANTVEINDSDDEEYTPKKQRMSRYKQEPYKCDVNGCGKMYKYISHYRHHQDSHKVQDTAKETVNKPVKQTRIRQAKASTVSFFLCKIPGCGAQVSNVTSLWKHYQDNHANSKAPIVQLPKNNQVFRCKILNCNMEFRTSIQLYKHFNDLHTNVKTGGDSNFRYGDDRSQSNTVVHENFKTDFKANCKVNADYEDDNKDGRTSITLTRIKEESRD